MSDQSYMFPEAARQAAANHRKAAHRVVLYQKLPLREAGHRITFHRPKPTQGWRVLRETQYTTRDAMAPWGSWFVFDVKGRALARGTA